MGSPAEDIGAILALDSLGTLGTDIFIGKEPEVNILSITVYDTGGFQPNPAWLREEPTVQCMVKGLPGAYSTAWAKAQAIKDSLLGRPPTTVDTINYIYFVQVGDIISLGRDEKERPIIVSNWHLARELLSGGHRLPL